MQVEPEPGQERNRMDRFTDDSLRVFDLAQDEAMRFNHNYIGTEHLLCGLLRGKTVDPARVVLTNLGLGISKAREDLQFIIGRGEREVQGDIGLTPRAKRVIALAVFETKNDGVDFITTSHLLRGLIREGEGIAAGILEVNHISRERIMEELAKGQLEKELSPEEKSLQDLRGVLENSKTNPRTRGFIMGLIDQAVKFAQDENSSI